MSGKNGAFAFAVATAALVALSAPVASAATFAMRLFSRAGSRVSGPRGGGTAR
jgi:hypothetical protein